MLQRPLNELSEDSPVTDSNDVGLGRQQKTQTQAKVHRNRCEMIVWDYFSSHSVSLYLPGLSPCPGACYGGQSVRSGRNWSTELSV